MDLPSLHKWLADEGFSFGKQSFGLRENLCDWYAWRRSRLAARECECNGGRVQIVVTPYSSEINGVTSESVEVDLTGEASSMWWKLTAYSLTPHELKKNLPEIEKSLVFAWNALKKREGE